MKQRFGLILGPAMALGLLASCTGGVSEPEGSRQPGVLVVSGWSGNVPVNLSHGAGVDWEWQPGPDDLTAAAVLVAPDTVEAGEAFQITTHTVGPNGCWRSDGQVVNTFGRIVVLKPYDSHSGSEVCTEALTFLAHASTVVLYEIGEWTLRVDGRRLRMGDTVREEPVSARRTIIVR
jgi:hypothetical protein